MRTGSFSSLLHVAMFEAEFGSRVPEIVIDRDNVLTRRFTSARDYANEVAAARLYGDVHYSFSIDAGRRYPRFSLGAGSAAAVASSTSRSRSVSSSSASARRCGFAPG